MSEEKQRFGDLAQFHRAEAEFDEIFLKAMQLPDASENERHFMFGAIRRTNSLSLAFKQAVGSRNGQMAATLIRLNLDTLARFYAVYWADDTEGMTAEDFARDVLAGKNIRDFKFQGSKQKATDRWLIKKIVPLGDWIESVYKNTSGAIHFSSFHIKQVFDQASERHTEPDGSLRLEGITMSPVDTETDPERYRELQQAFLHITLMLKCAIEHRCEVLMDESPGQG